MLSVEHENLAVVIGPDFERVEFFALLPQLPSNALDLIKRRPATLTDIVFKQFRPTIPNDRPPNQFLDFPHDSLS